MDVKASELLHESADITIGDKHRLLGERVEFNTQASKRHQHSIKYGLVGSLKFIEDSLVSVLACMNHTAYFLFNCFFIVSFLTYNLRCLVPTNSLVVCLSFPLRIDTFTSFQDCINVIFTQMSKCPGKYSNLLPHVINIVFRSNFIAK